MFISLRAALSFLTCAQLLSAGRIVWPGTRDGASLGLHGAVRGAPLVDAACEYGGHRGDFQGLQRSRARHRRGRRASTDGRLCVVNLFSLFSFAPLLCPNIARFVPRAVERKVGIRHAFLVRHRDEGAFSTGLGSMWYSSSRASDASLIANLQSLLNVSDDLLASRDDSTAVKTVGEHVRIERMALATLIVVCQAPHTYYSCQEAIASSTAVLEKGTETKRGLASVCGVSSNEMA